MSFKYIKEHYKVPAEIGREILYTGDKGKERKGIIVEDKGNYIGVNFYDKKPEDVATLHPTWEVKYLGIATIRKVPKTRARAKQRYREYLNADCGCSFAEYLGIKPKH